jgi:trimeric autotransporter adhesin
MMNYYNPLKSGILSCFKKWNVVSVGSPPTSNPMKKGISLQWFASLLLFLFIGMSGFAQTTVIDGTTDGSFESSFGAGGWITNFGATPANNVLAVGNAATIGFTPTHGTQGVFVSNNGTSRGYAHTSAITWIYKDVTLPAGQNLASLTMDLFGNTADTGFDGIIVGITDQTYLASLTTGATGSMTATAVTGMSIATTATTNTFIEDGNYATATSRTFTFPGAALGNSVSSSLRRIWIGFRCDGSVGNLTTPYSFDRVNMVTAAPAAFTAAQGGLWNSPATWVGGVVPAAGNNITIPAGMIVTVNVAISYNNLTIDGTLQWGTTSLAMTLSGNLLINGTGKFLPYTTGGTGQTLNIAGNFQNDGYANLAIASTQLTFNGSGSTLSGSGIFQGDGSKGIIRALTFANTGSNSITTSQNLLLTAGLAHTAGSLNTNGKLTLDNTAQIYGLPINNQVASVAVSGMGSTAYSVNPVVFGVTATQWSNITGVLNTIYVSGNNVYRCSTAANIGPAAPTHTSGIAQNLLWIGTVGIIGTPFLGVQSHTAGTQYFLGGNLYTCTTTGTPVAGYFPVHTSGTVNSGTAQFLYVGSPATVTTNFDVVTGTVRSLNLTSAGSGYSITAPSIAFSVGVLAGTGSGATAAAAFFQQVAGGASITFQKSGGATVSGGLTINSDQGASVLSGGHAQSSSGVGNISTTNGGNNYTAVPTVGISGPTALNLITNPGSGYLVAPTVTVTGGTLVSGTALSTTNFTITVNSGVVESVYLTGTATYSVPPTLTLTASPGVTATLAFPASCWATATTSIGANRQLNNFVITNPGFGYVVAPTVGLLGGTFTTAATAPTARVGLYNLTLNNFSPSPAPVASGEDAAIPANRKINILNLGAFSAGLNLTSSLTLYGTAPLSLNASPNAPGSVINLGGNNLNFTWNGFGGATSTFGASNAYITNGSMSVTGRGGASSFNFPFSGTFNWFAGSTPTAVTTGSSVTRVTVSDTAAPTNATLGTGLAIGNRAYRVQLGTGVTGTTPQVSLGFNSQDGLTVTQDNLFVADGIGLTGAWTTRSTAFGVSGVLPATGSKATATVAPGPIVPTADSYYAWATAAPTVTNFAPLSLCANSSTFTITGTNLTGVSAVTIGGTPAASFTVVNATTITGVVAAGTSGFVAITKSASVTTGVQAITVNPSPAAPSVAPASASVNLGGTVTITATGGAGTFNWYNVATGGAPIFTGATYSAPACATGTLYVSENDGACDGLRTAVPVTVTSTVITATPATFCGTGGTVSLSVTPSDPSITYTWTSLTPSATLLSSTGENVSATVTENSDFTVTATNGACSATASFSVSVYPLPSATVTTSANGVCPGTSATINSGLAAGNFSSVSITHAPRTAPGTATTLVSANVFNVPLTSGTGDDGGWGSIPVGFTFNFFGTSYSTINIGTNGTLTFGTYNGTALADFTFTTLPSTLEPFNMVAVLAMDNDLRSADGGAIKYWTEGIAPNRKFVVSYEAVKEFGDTKYSTAQAVFFETTGIIEPHITSSTNVDRVKLVGVNNGTGTVGVLAYNSGTAVTANPQNPIANPFAFRFSPPANYTTVWTADTGSGPTVIASGTNIFSQLVSPLVTTTYAISYTNQTTGCTNAPGSAQVVMAVLGTVAPTGVNTLASLPTVCLGGGTTLSLDYVGLLDGLTFQWQQDTGAGYTDISGATATTFVATPTVVTSYRCVITSCASVAGQSTSTPITITFTNTIDTTTPGTRCGAGPVSLAATTSSVGATINWYTAASGGTAIFTGSPLNVANQLIGTTTYYVAAETTGPACSSPRVAVTATATTPAVPLTLSTGTATICTGLSSSAITLTSGAGFYDTYTWAPATGVTGDEFVGWTFNPTSTTTYTLTATQTGGLFCLATATVVITVNTPNVTTAVSATPICLGLSTTISATSVGITSGPQTEPSGYASSNATSTNDEEILNVTFGTLNNSSVCNVTAPGAGSLFNQYSNFTGVTAPTVTAGAIVPVSVNVGTCNGVFTSFTNVYIDYNRNGVFDATELAFSSPVGVSGPHLVSGNITIPITATAGVTRMRVLNIENGSTASSPTGTYGFGETEDYNVNIIGVADVTGSYTYSWSPGGATTASVIVTPTVGGLNTYTVTATSPEGCVTTGTVNVYVDTDPVDVITGGAAAMCIGSGTIDFDTTTVGVTWSSSNPAVASVDANGVVTALTAGTTTINAFINNLTTGCITYAANPQTITVYNPLAITVQPTDQSVLDPSVATFSITATGSILASPNGYQWQVSPNTIVTNFVNIANDATYSGVTTPTLSINATAALTGLYYRCLVNGNSPCATPLASDPARLTVSDLAFCTPQVDPASAVICTTGTGSHTFNACFDGATPDSVVWEYYDLTNWVILDGTETTLGAITYSETVVPAIFPATISTATLTLNNLALLNNGWKVRVNGIVGATVITSAEALITVNQPATISVQPVDQTNCYAGGTSSFSVTAAGGTGYQWQYSTSAAGPWTNVVNSTPAGASYTGATTASMSVATTAATPAAGTYFYQVVVTSPTSCANATSASAQLNITTPAITATASSAVICQPGGTAVTLTGSGAGAGGTYVWSPTTGLTGTGAVVTANPTATTTYTVTGTTATGCSNTATVTVTVSDAVTATATATPATVCSGANSQLNAVVGGAGNTVDKYAFAASSATFVPLSGGTNSTASGDDGSENGLAIGFPFTYNGTSATTFSINTNGFIKIGANVQGSPWVNGLGTNTSIVGAMWDDNNRDTGSISYLTTGTAPNRVLTVEWNSITIGGGGSTGVPNSSFQVQLFETTNQIKMNYGGLDDSNGISASIGISGAVGKFLSVTPAAVATASAVTANNGISSVTDIPSGTVYTFSPPTLSYSWSPATFLSSTTIANPVATGVTATTVYTVTVTSGAGCTATAITTVTLASGIAITTQPVAASFCQGTTATLSVVATGAGLTYQWRLGGVDIVGQTAATLSIPASTPANSGSYDVVINDICGSPAVTSSAVTLTINPTPTATSPGNQTACSGVATAPITLSGTPGGVAFNITGGAAIGLANQTGVTAIPSFTPITGTATITVTPVANTCTGTAITFTYTVNETPSAIIVTPASSTICSTDNAVLLSATGGTVAPSAYCIPTVTSTGATSDNITNFTFAGINNTTGDGPGDYNAYLSPSAVVTAGSATPFSITPNPAFGQQFRVYVDMNQNGVFEATESVFNTTVSSTATVAGNITIPNTAFNGTTRLRVQCRFSSATAATEACAFSGFGEYEDYTVTISGATAPPSPFYVWTSSNGGLFTDALHTIAYTGTPAASVYAYATATVTATRTVAACPSSGSASVTVTPATTYYQDFDGDGFGNPAVTQLSCTGAPVGYVADNTDCNDNAFSLTNSCNSIVNLKLFVEGYYIGSGAMASVNNNQGGVMASTDVETLTVELHDATLAVMATTTGMLHTDGTLQAVFTTSPSGSFYISVRGSNFIRTWSAATQTVGNTPLLYDFSTGAAQAAGGNMKDLGSGVFGFFSGDLDLPTGDGFIDVPDYSIWETDYNASAFGAYPTDMDGDGFVDVPDYTLWESNYNAGVFEITP